MLWQCVNRERYLVYQRAWKDFYRAWQQDRVGEWPTSEPFLQQHRRVCEAVRRRGLPPAQLGTAAARQAVYERGQARAATLVAATPEEMQLSVGPRCHVAVTSMTDEPTIPADAGGHPGDRIYPERYCGIVARGLGEDRAPWARLPCAERMRELAWYHAHFNTPDDLSPWPAELDRG